MAPIKGSFDSSIVNLYVFPNSLRRHPVLLFDKGIIFNVRYLFALDLYFGKMMDALDRLLFLFFMRPLPVLDFAESLATD